MRSIVGVGRRAMRPAADEARALASESLLDFVPRVSPKFSRPSHLERLASVLERATSGEVVRALVSVPPRHGKTELLLHGIPWALERRPELSIAYVTYEAKLAYSKSRQARDYARRAGVQARRDADALHEWLTPMGGGLRAAGIGGPITGHGFGIVIVDDPFKNREEAQSLTIRERNWGWFTSTAMTRLDPNGSAIIVHTRWHEDDLIGRCVAERRKFEDTLGLEGESWEYINLPAIDESGRALWPERWPVDILDRRRRVVGPYEWASLFQGSPRPKEGKLFRNPVRYDRPTLANARIVIGVDVAGTRSTKANWTVAVVFAFTGSGDELRGDVLAVLRMQEEIPEVCRQLEALQKRWGGPLVVEASGIGKAVPQTLRDTNHNLFIVEVYPHADKWARAQAYAAAWNQGRIRLSAHGGAEVSSFIAVHADFTGMDDPIDDDVDAAAHGFNYALDGGTLALMDPSEYAHVGGLMMANLDGY